jgi:thioredoxin 1
MPLEIVSDAETLAKRVSAVDDEEVCARRRDPFLTVRASNLKHRAQETMPIIALTDATFVDEVKKPGLIFIDFWAAWCAPCRAFAPVFEKVAGKHPGVRFAKVDTGNAPAVADALGIRSIPPLLLIRDGEVIFA